MVARVGGVGRREDSGLNRLKIGHDARDFFRHAGQWPQHDEVILRLGQHDPFPATGLHERSNREATHGARLPKSPG